MVRIAGKVQGVGFRAWTREQAMRLGLSGWVRNEPDGTVLALLVGPAPAVATMLERLWIGPEFGSVSSVESDPAELAERPAGFRIAR